MSAQRTAISYTVTNARQDMCFNSNRINTVYFGLLGSFNNFTRLQSVLKMRKHIPRSLLHYRLTWMAIKKFLHRAWGGGWGENTSLQSRRSCLAVTPFPAPSDANSPRSLRPSASFLCSTRGPSPSLHPLPSPSHPTTPRGARAASLSVRGRHPARAPSHLNQQLAVLLDIFVCGLLFLLLFGFHRHVDVNP